MKLFLTRQYLEDLCRHFLPYMIRVLEARLRSSRHTDQESQAIVCLSVLEDLELMFQRKTLTVQKKFTIKLKKAEAVILMELMKQFPLMEKDFWRMNLRNYIIDQLYQQLQKELV